MNSTYYNYLSFSSIKKTTLLILLFLSSICAFAQPQYFNNTYVGGSNAIPFTPNSSTTFQRAQFVWGPGAFTGATAGAINKVYFYAFHKHIHF